MKRSEKFLQLILACTAAADLLAALDELWPPDLVDVAEEMENLRRGPCAAYPPGAILSPMAVQQSPERARRHRQFLRRQERRWQSQNGPLVSYKAGQPHPEASTVPQETQPPPLPPR